MNSMPDLRYALRESRRCGDSSASVQGRGANKGVADRVRRAR